MRDKTLPNRTLTGLMALVVALTVGLLTTPKRARADSPNLPGSVSMAYQDNLGPGLTRFGSSGTMAIFRVATDSGSGTNLIEVALAVTDSNGFQAFLQGSGLDTPFFVTSNSIGDLIAFVLYDQFGTPYLYSGVLFHDSSYSRIYFDSSHGFSGGEIEVQDLLFFQIHGSDIFFWNVLR